mgnify:FL=1
MAKQSKTISVETIRRDLGGVPRLVAWLEAHFTEENEGAAKKLIDAADDSSYTLRQWIESLVVLGEWLHSHHFEAALEDQIGYVGCACASVSSTAGFHSLALLVEEMLSEYGFERAVPKVEE